MSLAEYVSENKDEIKEMLQETDTRTVQRGMNPAVTDSFAVEFGVKPAPEKVTIQTYEAEVVTDANGRRRLQRTDRQKTVAVPYYIDYYGSKNVRFPHAYIIAIPDPDVIELLKIQGIKTEKLIEPSILEVERFEIGELRGSPRLNQGHYTNTVKGKFVQDTVEFPAGTIVVRTAQPLANLAAYLLEPQSTDGLLTWNFLDRYLIPQWGIGYNPFPVYKVINKTDLKTY
jgi:hypothetical protein